LYFDESDVPEDTDEKSEAEGPSVASKSSLQKGRIGGPSAFVAYDFARVVERLRRHAAIGAQSTCRQAGGANRNFGDTSRLCAQQLSM